MFEVIRLLPLNGNERLKVLYDYYHLGDEGSFDFDIKKVRWKWAAYSYRAMMRLSSLIR